MPRAPEPPPLEPRAAYLHVPFCAHRCGYCNFTVVQGRGDLVESYVAALERELSWLATPRPVDTLFIGGGTPTQLPPAALARVLELARRWFPLALGGEWSVEANPLDITADLAALLAAHGVTRVSLGAQSFDAARLAVLERDHRADAIGRAVDALRGCRLHVALDLIFGVPRQVGAHEPATGVRDLAPASSTEPASDEVALALWRADLESALALGPVHVSTYGLTFERGTTYWGRRSRGELVACGEELELAQYAAAIDRLEAAGFEHYEVSNFARPGHRCRHNEVYWAAEEYFAAGPGAARYVAGRRETNHRSTSAWLERVLAGRSPVAEWEELPPRARACEAAVLGLRRMRGIERRDFAERTGFQLDELLAPALAELIDAGLLLDDGHCVRLSRRGLYVSDALWSRLLR